MSWKCLYIYLTKTNRQRSEVLYITKWIKKDAEQIWIIHTRVNKNTSLLYFSLSQPTVELNQLGSVNWSINWFNSWVSHSFWTQTWTCSLLSLAAITSKLAVNKKRLFNLIWGQMYFCELTRVVKLGTFDTHHNHRELYEHFYVCHRKAIERLIWTTMSPYGRGVWGAVCQKCTVILFIKSVIGKSKWE